MRILDFYIARIITQQTIIVFAVLVGLFVFVTFIDQLGDIGTNRFGVWEAVRFTALTVPQSMYELFPMAALLGSILGLSLMANDSELVVVRASGVSNFRIAGSVLKIGAVMALAAMLIGEFVTPAAETMAERGRAEALQRHIKQQTDFGLWMRDTHTYVNIGEVLPDLTLLRVRIFEFDDQNRLRAYALADEGQYAHRNWELENVKQTIIDDQGIATVRRLPVASWATTVSPQILSVFLIKPDQLSIWQLNHYISHLRENNQETRRYELAFWGKIFLPLSTAVMVVLALPFVFRHARSGGLGRSLFTGIMLGISFYVVNKAFGNFVLVYGVPPFIGALTPVVAFLLAALVMLRRV